MSTQHQKISKCKNCGAGFLVQRTDDFKPAKLCTTCYAKLRQPPNERHQEISKLVTIDVNKKSDSPVMVPMQGTKENNLKQYVAVPGNVSSIRVLSADLRDGKDEPVVVLFDSDLFIFTTSLCSVEKIPITEVVQAVVLDEEARKSLFSAIARGVVGSALFGLVGAGAGVVSAKNAREVTLGIRFRDGRSFVGVTNSTVANRIHAFLFTHKPNGDQRLENEPQVTTEDLTAKLIVSLILVLAAIAAPLFFAIRTIW